MTLTGMTDAQRAALRTFMLTGELPQSARLSNNLFQRGLVARIGQSVVLTEAGKRALEPKPEVSVAPKKKKGAADPEHRFKARQPTDCCVDGCDKKVYGTYTMCRKHLDAFVDGRLPPRSQALNRSLRDVVAPAVNEKGFPVSEPKTAPPTERCIEPGCNAPRHTRSDGKSYQRCKPHYDAHRRAKRTAQQADRQAFVERETPRSAESAPQIHPSPSPSLTGVPAASPIPASESPLPALVDQVVGVADELVPGMLDSLIRQALTANPESLKLTVTGLRVTFSGEIEIGAD